MASKFLRRQEWWIRLHHFETGRTIRYSLETDNESRAELLGRRMDLEVALLDPILHTLKIPPRLRQVMGSAEAKPASSGNGADTEVPHPATTPSVAKMATRTKLDEAVVAYLRLNRPCDSLGPRPAPLFNRPFQGIQKM